MVVGYSPFLASSGFCNCQNSMVCGSHLFFHRHMPSPLLSSNLPAPPSHKDTCDRIYGPTGSSRITDPSCNPESNHICSVLFFFATLGDIYRVQGLRGRCLVRGAHYAAHPSTLKLSGSNRIYFFLLHPGFGHPWLSPFQPWDEYRLAPCVAHFLKWVDPRDMFFSWYQKKLRRTRLATEAHFKLFRSHAFRCHWPEQVTSMGWPM